MKRIIICAVLILLLVNLTGCHENVLPQRIEIDDLHLVQVIGIDKLLDSDNDCMVTVASKDLEKGVGQDGSGGMGGSTGGGVGKALVLSSVGKTMFDAIRNIQTHSNKTIFWGHSDYYLIGEEAARDNIVKYLDFFTRDHELRIEAKIYIVKGSTAKDLIEQFNQGEFYIFDKLGSLGKNLKLTSNSEEMKIHTLMRFIDIHHASARVPAIYLKVREDGKGSKIYDIETAGYAIFSNFRLAGFIGTDISRGLNLIANTVESSIVAVKDLTGQDASLEIIDSNTQVVPKFKGDDLESITLKTKVISNLAELQSQTADINEKLISSMESQQSEILKKEMEQVLKKVQNFESDCLGICDKIRLKNPLKWRKIEDKWIQMLPDVKIDVQVESEIQRTYEIKEPSGYKRNRRT